MNTHNFPDSDSEVSSIPPSISVVIPTRNAEAYISQSIDSILAQDYAGPIEILVADGSDTPATSELIRQYYPEVRLIANPDKSTGHGGNLGFEAATGDIIIRCDSHVTFPTEYVSRAVETLERTGAANIGGWQQPVGTTLFEKTVAIAMTTPLGVGDSRHRLRGKEGVTDTAFLGVFRRETLEEIGGYDTSLARNQDYELNYRLRKQGKIIWFDPELVSSYRPRSTLWALINQYFNYGRWKSVVIWKHPTSARLRHIASPALVLAFAAGGVLALVGILGPIAILLFTYIMTIVVGSVVVGFRRREALVAFLPLVLTAMHLSWGIGFLVPARLSRGGRHDIRPDTPLD